jgi:hypothetical protein
MLVSERCTLYYYSRGTARSYTPSAHVGDSRASVLLAHLLLSLTHGLGLNLKGHATQNVLLATHAKSISYKHRRIRGRSWFHTVHSVLHAASRGSGDCSSSLLLDVTLFEKVVVTGSPRKIHSLAPNTPSLRHANPTPDRASQRWQVYAAECSNAAEEIGCFEQ